MNLSILILDCGATNVKACLVDSAGQILSSHSLPNNTVEDPFFQGGLIWDINDIWKKLTICTRKVVQDRNDTEIIGVTVTTFGVDGAAMNKDGSLCYPVISWQCSRTEKIERDSKKYFDPGWLYKTTGLQSYHFNTLYKLIWLRENRPEVLDKMDYYVLMPSLIIQRLSGEFITDTTMAGTSMLTDIKKRGFSSEILDSLELNPSIFPKLKEPGTVAGKVQADAAEALGIKPGIAVIASGHDTQFAILGSGAGENQPVLSSGTWEILMARTKADSLNLTSQNSGVTTELDTLPGLVDIGVQWVASGVLEWVSRLLYPGLSGNSLYTSMIQEAASIPSGCNGMTMIPELFPGGFSGKKGNFQGFTHETTRAHFYRASLEALSYYSCYGLDKLQQVGNFRSENVICVGGGSKNTLWNQIRADVLGIPVKALDMKETTALGAAMLAFTGLKIYSTIEEANSAVHKTYVEYCPGREKEKYREDYLQYVEKVF